MTISSPDMDALLEALDWARGDDAPAFDREGARADLSAALAMFRRQRERDQDGELSKADRRRRRDAFKQLAAHLRAAGDKLGTVVETPGFSEPLRAAWQQASGEDAYEEDVEAQARSTLATLDAWAAAAELATALATAPRGRPQGSDLQRLMSVLAGTYQHHTGREPSPKRDPQDFGFLEFAERAAHAEGLPPEDGASALRKIMERSDWIDALAWRP